MLGSKRVLAIVPARSGSRGIPDKNMREVAGMTLIARAGATLGGIGFVDRRIISTDDQRYADEGQRAGLDAPFLRPAELSTDEATAIDVVVHALEQMEALDATTYDVVLVVEPTSPLRRPGDIEGAAALLVDGDLDSVVTVSVLPDKMHPHKALEVRDGSLEPFLPEGRLVTRRQQLSTLYWRNGACYAATRSCVLEQRTLIGERCGAYICDHMLVNVDEEWELEWADWLLRRETSA
jgi:CMP-N-acetylneuraminic acid synthetase